MVFNMKSGTLTGCWVLLFSNLLPCQPEIKNSLGCRACLKSRIIRLFRPRPTFIKIFLPIKIDQISSIPLGNCISPNSLAWLPNWDGIDSVKQRYHFAKLLKDIESLRTKSVYLPIKSTAFWKKLWMCDAPIIIFWA